jgi:hypothetical protein
MPAIAREEVARFLRNVNLNRMADEKARWLYQARLAPDFNPFEFIKADELGLSRVVGWMLDRRGTHGQGSQFLRLFAERFKIPWPVEACDESSTRVEVWIDGQSRIDILVESAQYVIAVENKPFAADMKDQLARYFRYLDDRKLKHSCLIYLTPLGTSPSEFSIVQEHAAQLVKSDRLLPLSYDKQLLAWVNDCRSACRADRVTTFLDQFADLIGRTFDRRGIMEEHRSVIEEILSSEENVRSAVEVMNAAKAFQSELLGRLRHDLQSEVVAEGWELHWPSTEKLDFEIDFGPQTTARFRIGIESSVLYYGATLKERRAESAKHAAAALYDKLKMEIGPNKPGGPYWAWYGAVADDRYFGLAECWVDVAQPWLSIRDGSLVPKTMRAALRMRDLL